MEENSKGDFLYIFFQLLNKGKCDIPTQISLFKELNHLIGSHTQLKIHCCKKRWVLRLLQMIETIEDDRLLGSFLLSPSFLSFLQFFN